jgi:hypothetical protein
LNAFSLETPTRTRLLALACALLVAALATVTTAVAAPTASPAPARAAAALAKARRAAAQSKSAAKKSAPTATPVEPVASSSRRLEDVRIEGELEVPRITFITVRQPHRFTDYTRATSVRSSRRMAAETALPAWIPPSPNTSQEARKESPK